VQKLHHQPREPVKSARNARRRVYLNEHVLLGPNVNLTEVNRVQ
jgi:hypothetical protein